MNKTIIFFTCYPFPNGLASTNRIIGYCRGFIRNGYTCEVICFRPTEKINNIVNRNVEGTYKDIKFIYPGKISIRSSKFIVRRINDLKSLVISIKTLYDVLKNKDVKFIIFYGKNFLGEISSIIISKLCKKPIFKEENENPHVFFRNCRSFLCKIYEYFYIHYVYRLYDAILVMTNPLKEFFLNIGIKRESLIPVPQFVDVEKYARTEEGDIESDYIAYAGSLNEKKDGILTLIKAYSILNKRYPDLVLKIAGFGTESELDKMKDLLRELRLELSVKFIGCLHAKDMPAFLHNAKILISCRPQSLQSEYGFPTKIVEYLASGKPTVTTLTGDLRGFLQDDKNAFIIDELNVDNIVAKVDQVLEDYDHALHIAQNGYQLVLEQFDPTNHTKHLLGI